MLYVRQMVSPEIYEHGSALSGAKPNPKSRRLKTKVQKIFDTTIGSVGYSPGSMFADLPDLFNGSSRAPY
ncbi:hypothetical protein GCM10011316_36590 [Roseibium aquae]|uniref:Uncharacterized protein n=1 Tax=Roseibium aquae TaxID=1323746 RepID=A0A916X383_9HYPH|nr:hypothetical protein GCM10011316_36590 [Roseibium aquae]